MYIKLQNYQYFWLLLYLYLEPVRLSEGVTPKYCASPWPEHGIRKDNGEGWFDTLATPKFGTLSIT